VIEAVTSASEHIPASGPGAMLSRGRADKGLSIADIAAQLRYSPRQIEALERDDYARLPGNTFVKGMIRGYAKILGTSPAPILGAFEQQHQPSPVTVDLQTKPVPFPDGKARSARIYLWLSVVLAVLVLAVLYEWRFGLPEPLVESVRTLPAETAGVKASEPVVQTAQLENVVESSSLLTGATSLDEGARPSAAATGFQQGNASSANPTSVPGMVNLRFEFQKDAWLEVKDRAGRTLISQLNPSGTQVALEGQPPFELVIGNASNVRMTWGDKLVDLRPHVKVNVARFTLDGPL